MASIPYDPGLVLGNLVDPARIEHLMDIAAAQQPMNAANDRLNNLMQANYKIGMITNQMVSMNVSVAALLKLKKEQKNLKKEMAKAAMLFSKETISAERKVRELKKNAPQNQISMNIETPMDYVQSAIAPFDIAFDTLSFDVQYFQKNEATDSIESFSRQVSAHGSRSESWWGENNSQTFAGSMNSQMVAQQKNSELEGTIVISAHTTHRSANVMSPFVMDARKAITAWNYSFPDDLLETTPDKIFEAAMQKRKEGDNVMHLLSGYTKGSSFVGFVHILRKEHTMSDQKSASTALTVASAVRNGGFVSAMTGMRGGSSSLSSSAESLLSGSELSNSVSLTCMGHIPNISASDMETTVDSLRPDPADVINQLGAITANTDGAVNKSMESTARDGTAGRQFIELNSDHLSKSISATAAIAEKNNKVIDLNAMMRAFDDYCRKAEAGEVGVPVNFYLKQIPKSEVAKTYIRRFYSNGASSGRSGITGQLGQDAPGATDTGDR
mmetsp:Transcript_20903/g.31663  ORF Transcript_20903/g.31663 Transcript_20903/m.31663 type:complete len:499 (+) Transcript_20903:110-1606(+)|eukprot:CAMPEP_0194252810 /NCGR_PEP_ID=MMETSP0158-20130606/28487_1 /TAXON_ID=33649 /ORGANISM="Thalassionema nitzschioides, Strain L26-B" /LENGTH=498 /DNA_ID=CAMNT_0038990321 /DNA_START=46 /DNA_END=1542 /DNA_ORIENTATION=-